MAQRTNTVEYVFDTRLTTLATGTTLAGATRHDYAAQTLYIPETTSRTIRSVIVVVTARDAETTTARRVDGCRIGIKLGAVAFDDLDLTGTGIANTGDPYTVAYSRDVTSYFVSNFGAGTSQTCQVGVAFETDVASLVNNITAKVIITYEYDDASLTTAVKTVRIPLEGITGFLGTVANTDIRGSTGAAQIPALDTFLPEASKTYRQYWLEVYAADGGAAATDFNVNYSIDAGTTATRATLEQVLNGSALFYDIWDITAYGMTTNATHDFEAWSSLASRFERLYAVLYVTYEYNASTTTTVLNSLLIPLDSDPRSVPGTTSGDQDVYENTFYIEEPSTVTMVQSGLQLFWMNGGAGNLTVSVSGHDSAGGSQGTTSSLYTGTAFIQAGSHSLGHRLDVAHGTSAVTLGRGKNTLRCKIFCSASNAVTSLCGFYIINYTSGKASGGVGVHNHSTFWSVFQNIAGSIAGTSYGEIATSSQQTLNIPETEWWRTSSGFILFGNHSASGAIVVRAESLSGELQGGDGWAIVDTTCPTTDGEFGLGIMILRSTDVWDRHSGTLLVRLDNETARKYRIEGILGQWSLTRLFTYHAITYTVAGTVTGYTGDGSGITVDLHRASDGEKLESTTTAIGGTYSITWHDNTEEVYTVARQDSTHLGRSDNAVAA